MPTIYSIQVLRGLAALVIALGHLDNYAGIHNISKGVSWVGIDLFFVISGFVIAYTIEPYRHERSYVKRFLTKRLVRIYPTYWLIGLLGAVAAVWAGYRDHLQPENYVMSFFLYPQRIAEQFIPVAWSLHFELLFYGITAMLLLLLGRHFWKGVLVWVAMLFAAQFVVHYVPSPTYNWEMYFGSFYQFEFMCGLLVGYLLHHQKRVIPTHYLWAITAIGTCVVIGGLGWGYMAVDAKQKLGDASVFIERCTVLGIGFGLLLYGLSQLERNKVLIQFPKGLLRLGGASYVLYLMHDIIFILCGKSWELMMGHGHITTPMISYTVFMPLVFAIMLIVTVQFSERVEQPMIRWLKAKTK